MSDVVGIAAGGYHSMAVKADGTLWTFGRNLFGQLGRSTIGEFDGTPTQVMTDVVHIAAGADHSMAVKADGTLWTFGRHLNGQLGLPTTDVTVIIPTQVTIGQVTRVAAGSSHSLALTSDGVLWAFGNNANGQLGITFSVGSTRYPLPTEVMAHVTDIAAGSRHSLVMTSDGVPWAFGSNAHGQLGTTADNRQNSANRIPTRIPLPSLYVPLTPGRLLDTRQPASPTIDGLDQAIGTRPAGSTTELHVTGRAGVPTTATAIALNLTVTAPRGPGYLTVWPCGTDLPNASNLNYTTGQTIANTVITKPGTNGNICLYTENTTELIADINGYYPA